MTAIDVIEGKMEDRQELETYSSLSRLNRRLNYHLRHKLNPGLYPVKDKRIICKLQRALNRHGDILLSACLWDTVSEYYEEKSYAFLLLLLWFGLIGWVSAYSVILMFKALSPV